MSAERTEVTVETTVSVPVAKAWELWTNPRHIIKWNTASDEWHTPRAENDLRVGGKWTSRMEAKDGSMGFDFGGEYTEVRELETLASTMGDGRRMTVRFRSDGNETHVSETFETESENPVEMQRAGWQAIMDNFKKYADQH
jgi:uncharacterized protein YndB with AHSA1/START domain